MALGAPQQIPCPLLPNLAIRFGHSLPHFEDDFISLTTWTAATAAVAGGSALAAYLNARFHLGKDLDGFRKMKSGEWDYKKASKSLQISFLHKTSTNTARH